MAKVVETERPLVTVTRSDRELPCCGADVNEQPYCSVLSIPHLLVCECGAAWAFEGRVNDGDEEGLRLEAQTEARCTGKTDIGDARIWWETI